MATFVVLLRGINVGGRNRVKMADLRDWCAQCGCTDVQTYIQSGNIVLNTADRPTVLAQKLGDAFDEHAGFVPQMLVLPARDLGRALADCPYQGQAQDDPKSVHLFFLAQAPAAAGRAAFDALPRGDEQTALHNKVLFLHTPRGLSSSKLAARAERALGVATTARNWRSCCAVASLAGLDVPTA